MYALSELRKPILKLQKDEDNKYVGTIENKAAQQSVLRICSSSCGKHDHSSCVGSLRVFGFDMI